MTPLVSTAWPVSRYFVSCRFHSESWGFGLECCECASVPSASLIRKPSFTVWQVPRLSSVCVHTFIYAGVYWSCSTFCSLTCTNLITYVSTGSVLCMWDRCMARASCWAVVAVGWKKWLIWCLPGFIVNGQIFSIGSLPLLPPTLSFHVVFFELFPHSQTYKKGLYFYF